VATGRKINPDNIYSFQNPLTKSNYAYIMEWNEWKAPAALYALLQAGLEAKLTNKNFSVPAINGKKTFAPGSVLITLANQKLNAEQVFELLQKTAAEYAVPVYATQTGLSVEGVDLGSGSFSNITKPVIALLVGSGVNATDAGEVWHLLDQRMDIPLTLLEINSFNKVDPAKYNTIIMVGGTYTELNKDKLKSWVQNGGVLICTEEAIQWSAANGISDVKFKKTRVVVDSSSRIAYNLRENITASQQMAGAIFEADADRTHPLAYGYTTNTVPLFKANTVFMEKSRNPFATPFYYKNNSLQSGWASMQNKEAISNSAAVLVNTVGTGRVINIDNNPNFRGFWLGGTKLFMNAIFYGRLIDAASAKTE
jgi:hypothetical protein